MTRNRTILALAAVLALGVGGYLAYDNVLRGDDLAPLALPSASTGATTTGVPIASATPAASTTTDPGSETGVAGTWSVAEGEAGYRVRERLASLSAESDAVGRTTDVTGSITLVAAGDAAQLTEGSLAVDTTTLASDEDRRDNRLRTEGLETDAFPTATFTITAPIDIPAGAISGTATDVTLVGDLTLHGVTKAVAIPAQAQLVGGEVQVAGSLTFSLADFDITAPNVGGFIISIADEGALEFRESFAKA
jgi:polyisoprenoid-binding protein YceI